MALADIINRIDSDAQAEAHAIVREAEQGAESRRAELTEKAREDAALIVERAHRAAEVDAATSVAAARLAARDEALTARRALVEEALTAVVAALEGLPAAEYARFLADAVVAETRSGDVVALGAEDLASLDAVRAAVEARSPGLEITWSADPAPVARGAVVSGGRTRVELTPRALVEARRGELEIAIATRLFGPEGA